MKSFTRIAASTISKVGLGIRLYIQLNFSLTTSSACISSAFCVTCYILLCKQNLAIVFVKSSLISSEFLHAERKNTSGHPPVLFPGSITPSVCTTSTAPC